MSKMHVSLQMEKYNRVYMCIYDFKYLEGYTTGSSACPQEGGLSLILYPLILLDFVLCALLLFQLKKLKCI